jgi:phage shock protein E
MKNPIVLAVTILLLVLSGFVHAGQDSAVAPRVLVIDVRTEQEWNDGHLQGAILIPHDRIGQGIAAVAPDKKERIYLYCRSGRRTGLAVDTLKKAGYQDLVNLETVEKASRELNVPVVK